MTREEAIAKINRLRDEYNEQYIDYCGTNEAVNMAIEALKAETKRGRWIEVQRINPTDRMAICECSECGDWWGSNCNDGVINDFSYCPNCGAKMDEVEEC